MAREFLGTGWKFPLGVTPGGRIALARQEQRIEEAVYHILATAQGERVMRPDFGCGVHDLVFAPNSATTLGRVKQDVLQALVRYEPRIDVLEVSTEISTEAPNVLLIRVHYRIRANNAIGNLVYPFYITEAS
jgi:uncharacterized protein